MRSKGTASELESRRRIGVEKLQDGRTQVQVADFLGVHPVTVAKWTARHRLKGNLGLAAKPTPGRPRFLTPAQERAVQRWLADKPTAQGLRTDLWTARRVADLIHRRSGWTTHCRRRASTTSPTHYAGLAKRRPRTDYLHRSRHWKPSTAKHSKNSALRP